MADARSWDTITAAANKVLGAECLGLHDRFARAVNHCEIGGAARQVGPTLNP